MRKRISKWVLPLLSAGLLVFAVIHVVKAQHEPPNPPPPVDPARTPFGDTVAGAGIAEAQTENIAIGSALPGVVLEVYVPVEKVGIRVTKGTALFRVDDRQLQAQLRYQVANLAAARAQLAKLEAMPRPEELPSSEAKVRAAEANVALLDDQFRRARRLQPGTAMSEEEYRQRQLGLEVGRHQLAQAQADFKLLKAGAWKPDLDIARAAILQAEAQVQQTKTDIERALVCAPVEGEVLQVNVRTGEFVGAPPSQALVVLGNIHQLHVRVDIDEHDIPRFKPGAPARASLRGDTQHGYPLRFVRVEPYVIPKKSLTGDNTERVDTRVLQVIYALDATDKPIYVGQQLDVFIDVGVSASAEQETLRLAREVPR
jgi:multidrug resistance efflux pump